MSAVVFLLVCFLSCSVSEDLKITPQPGDDVTLPCKAPNNVTIVTVEWIRSDLKRHLFMKRDGHLNTADQDPSYVNRVQLKDDEMKNGELSLILKNVNNKDEGTYECRYAEETATKIKLISIVYLNVEGRQIKEITAQPGENVTLPCKAPNNVNIAAVEWSRSDPERLVYLKSDGRLDPADQDPSYVNRVQLKDNEMKNGDLSLTLKTVNNNDTGRYECLYKEERGSDQMKLSSFVQLNVKEPPITVEAGQTVTLPCRAPNNITIAAVKWIRSNLDPGRYVYFQSDGRLDPADQDPSYENRVQLKDDEMKNGELSLILKNVNNNDEGTYECHCIEKRGGRRKRAAFHDELISIVQLKVEDGDSRDGKHSESGQLGVILPVTLIAALVAVVVGFIIFKKRKGRPENNSDLPDDPDVL